MSQPAATEMPKRPLVQVSRPTHARLMELKQARQERLGRQVSFDEIIAQALDRLEKAGAA